MRSMLALISAGLVMACSEAVDFGPPVETGVQEGFEPAPEQSPMPTPMLVAKRTDITRAKYPVVDITTLDLLKRKTAQDHPDIVYLAPDIGSQKRTGLEGTEKDRTDSYVVDIKSNEHFKTVIKNKTVGAVDDLLETGGTMDRFYDECIKCGAKEVVALVTHGVLKQGIDKVKNKYSRLYLTNSVDRSDANVDVAELILKTVL